MSRLHQPKNKIKSPLMWGERGPEAFNIGRRVFDRHGVIPAEEHITIAAFPTSTNEGLYPCERSFL
jgi:hypothetical protein